MPSTFNLHIPACPNIRWHAGPLIVQQYIYNNMTKLIANAFSLQMLAEVPSKILVLEATEEQVLTFKAVAHSLVGHADTAKVLGVTYNRESVSLQRGDELLVAQLQGGRLPEGCTTLPEGFAFKYLLVVIE